MRLTSFSSNSQRMNVYALAAQFARHGGIAIIVDTEWQGLCQEAEIWRYIFFSIGVTEWYGYDAGEALRHHFALTPHRAPLLIAILAPSERAAMAEQILQVLERNTPAGTRVLLATPGAGFVPRI